MKNKDIFSRMAECEGFDSPVQLFISIDLLI